MTTVIAEVHLDRPEFGVSLRLRLEGAIALTGGSGAGKSSIIRALAPGRSLYLLDEPFAGLDVDSAALTEKFIAARIGASDSPFVIAGHDLPRLRRICPKVVRVERGRIVPLGHAVSGSAEPLRVR